MSDQIVESAATPEVQAEAEKMGWIPPSRFKGDADRFIDADAFVERGKTVLPIVKQQLETTRGELTRMNQVAAEQTRVIKALQDSVGEMQERHTVATQKAVERAREEVKAQLQDASQRGDHAAVAELTDELVTATAAVADAKTAAEKRPAPAAAAEVVVEDPAFVEWKRDNAWFGTNRRKTALALGIAEDLRASGESLRGRAFYDKVAAEVEKELGGSAPPVDKVGSGRNGSDGDTRAPGTKKGYAAMPADAKKACDADARDFVGPNKRYKDNAAWQAAYAKLYFEQE